MVIYLSYDRYITSSWSYTYHMTGICHNVIYQVYTWYMTVILLTHIVMQRSLLCQPCRQCSQKKKNSYLYFKLPTAGERHVACFVEKVGIKPITLGYQALRFANCSTSPHTSDAKQLIYVLPSACDGCRRGGSEWAINWERQQVPGQAASVPTQRYIQAMNLKSNEIKMSNQCIYW
jgi:hypothetical protein